MPGPPPISIVNSTPCRSAGKTAVARDRKSTSPPGAPQPHAWPTIVSIDEFDPRVFECPADGLIIGAGERGRARHQFGTTDGGDAQRSMAGKIFGAPADER